MHKPCSKCKSTEPEVRFPKTGSWCYRCRAEYYRTRHYPIHKDAYRAKNARMKDNHPGYKTQAMRIYRQKARDAQRPDREERKRLKKLGQWSSHRKMTAVNLKRRFRTWIDRESWVQAIQIVFLRGSQVSVVFPDTTRVLGNILAHINLGNSYVIRIEFEDCILDYDYHLLDPQNGLVKPIGMKWQ